MKDFRILIFDSIVGRGGGNAERGKVSRKDAKRGWRSEGEPRKTRNTQKAEGILQEGTEATERGRRERLKDRFSIFDFDCGEGEKFHAKTRRTWKKEPREGRAED